MRNRFAGPCYRCGETVEVGAGHFERTNSRQREQGASAKWLTQHAECAIEYRGTGFNAGPLPRPKATGQEVRS